MHYITCSQAWWHSDTKINTNSLDTDNYKCTYTNWTHIYLNTFTSPFKHFEPFVLLWTCFNTYTERERHTGHMQARMDKTHKPSSMETTRGWWPSGWQNDQSEGFTWPQSVKHTQTHPPIRIQPPVFIDTRTQWPNTGTHTPHSCWSVHTIRLRLINHWAQPSLCLLSLIWVYCLFVSGLWNIH